MNKEELRHLVVLKYAGNICYTILDRIEDIITEMPQQIGGGRLEINLEKEEWTFAHFKKPIGESRHISGYRGGVIGVYDARQIKHLRGLMYALREHHDDLRPAISAD